MPPPSPPYPDNSYIRRNHLQQVLFRRVRRSSLLGGLQLEIFFLAFFLPYVLLQSAWFDDQLKITRQFFDTVFPYSPTTAQVSRTLYEHAESTGARGSSPYGMETSLFFQWFNNVVYSTIELNGNGIRLGEDSSSTTLVCNVRFRQLRVNPMKTCPTIASQITKMNGLCYPPYSETYEAKADSPFGMNENGKPYVWYPSWITGDSPFTGTFATYPGSGFVVDLSFNSSTAKSQLVAMERSGWLDGPQPRALFLTMTFVDTNSGYVTFIRVLIELEPTLGTIATWTIASAPLYQTTSNGTTLQTLFWFSAVFQFFFVLRTMRDAYRMIRGECGHLRVVQKTCGRGIPPGSTEALVWFLLDVISSGIMIAQIVFGIEYFITLDFVKPVDAALSVSSKIFDSMRTTTGSTNSNNNNNNAITANGYYNGESVILWINSQLLFTTSILLSTFRLFRYSELFPFMRVFVRTLRRVGFDMLMYFILLTVMTIVYIMAGVQFWGDELYEWNSANTAFMVGFSFLQGTISYNRLVTDPFGYFFAPIFIFSFMFLFLWYIRKVFVAIVYFAYIQERDLLEKEDRDEKMRLKPLGIQRSATVVVAFRTFFESLCRIPNWCRREYEVSDRALLQFLLDNEYQQQLQQQQQQPTQQQRQQPTGATNPVTNNSNSAYISLLELKTMLVQDNRERNVLIQSGRRRLRESVAKMAGSSAIDVNGRVQELFNNVFPNILSESDYISLSDRQAIMNNNSSLSGTGADSLHVNGKNIITPLQGDDIGQEQEDEIAVSTMQRTGMLLERLVHNNDTAHKMLQQRLESLTWEQRKHIVELQVLKEELISSLPVTNGKI
jgi:hypothetical protein